MVANKLGFVLCLSIVAALSACGELGSIPNPLGMGSGTIHLESHARSGNSVILRSGQPVVLFLGDVGDARKGAPSRKVGEIRSTIIDMADTSLALDQDVSAIMLSALKEQLAADGFRTVGDPRAAHDFKIEATAKDFRLDIVDRDELSIAADMTLRDVKTGDVLWAGVVTERSSRYAGVSGNSRASIVSYFGKGLNAWAVKASANVRESLLRSYPQTMAVGERKEQAAPHVEGVTTLQEAKPREAATAVPVTVPPPLANPAIEAASATSAAIVAPAAGTGTFSVTTVPSKAKVYVDDVYYGTSPLKLEFEPGVMLFRFKLGGYKTVDEKVSIRRGETTELEVKFEK